MKENKVMKNKSKTNYVGISLSTKDLNNIYDKVIKLGLVKNKLLSRSKVIILALNSFVGKK